MADCECIEKCTFFRDRMADKMPIAALIQNKLCHNDGAECARHMVFERLGREAVPSDLFPVDTDRAIRILESGPRQ
ncbi:MAG: hypothetical protein FDZ70_03695 [Actinobacteria bacterium]|nr:MAG: hypothetical protein FDZ70_03695 [Actinomycetota bacterium]